MVYDLAVDLRALGKYERARALDEDTVARCCRVLGDDHSHTLASADNLAVDLRRWVNTTKPATCKSGSRSHRATGRTTSPG